jgi:hypothetical protein
MKFWNPALEISVATDKDRTDWKYGKQFFEALAMIDPRLEPDTLGYSDVPRERTPYLGLESAEKHWGKFGEVPRVDGLGKISTPFGFGWRRTKTVKHWGSIEFSRRNIASRLFMGCIDLSAAFDRKVDWLSLFKATCESQGAICGLLHLLTDPEFQDAHPQLPGSSHYFSNVGGYILERGIPNLAWATFFGGKYAADVDAEKLRAHGYHVESFLDGHLVLMSEKLTDILDDFWTFSRRRVELKKLFRQDLFSIKKEPVKAA